MCWRKSDLLPLYLHRGVGEVDGPLLPQVALSVKHAGPDVRFLLHVVSEKEHLTWVGGGLGEQKGSEFIDLMSQPFQVRIDGQRSSHRHSPAHKGVGSFCLPVRRPQHMHTCSAGKRAACLQSLPSKRANECKCPAPSQPSPPVAGSDTPTTHQVHGPCFG